MFDFGINEAESERKLGNVISLLLPARSYKLNCSWTQETPLPAIEEFSCRLLLALEELLPGELQEYFGLTSRECDVLVQSLIENKLASYTSDGLLSPSSMLQTKTNGNADLLPSLTKYEEKEESPVFDLLTLTILSRRSYNTSKYGLPEIPAPEGKSLSSTEIVEAFGKQYRAHLEYTRKNEIDVKKTRLYKVSTCEQDRILQVPIDLDINIETTPSGRINVIKDSSEKLGDLRRRPLSNKLESKISDYLNSLQMPSGGLSLEEYCHLFDDKVLLRYASNNLFDLNSWLLDRAERKTGYGNPQTRAMFGPIYLNKNRTLIEQVLKYNSRDWEAGKTYSALWLSSFAPLWAENGSMLGEFSRKIEPLLAENETSKGNLVALFPFIDYKGITELKRRFGTRIPSAVCFGGDTLQDRSEIFLIPGQLAVAQFHIHPSPDSSITIPIGFITTEPERLARIESILSYRLENRPPPYLAWTNSKMSAVELLRFDLGDGDQYEQKPQRKQVDTVVYYKPKPKKIIE
ncbi:hypothetical protein PPUJ20005_53020 [Pseudomonas putida]|uniref:hypothetical protein n=1 Tax=Pseudomonas putida TaxID=303 RepID=UPI00235CF8C7|nr:hypothetical protein [Pseudomonas putida]GLO11331.1 hypothetical protein PPUJ20005_53020 [Pseudomonas putida]HDS0988015.1 hypothetical protein [Pseudomonas putida]